MSVTLIKLENVSKVYKGTKIDTKVFENITLSIQEGDFTAIVGRSGSGKSTLLHIMGLLDKATSGNVFFDGINVSSLTDNQYTIVRNRSIGFVFQDFKLINDMTVFDNVEIPLVFSDKKTSKIQRREKIINLLGELDLYGKENAYPDELSGGQKQRVAIARALINDPKIILADEPTGNLDEKSTSITMDLLKRLNSQSGKTIVLVTHDNYVKSFSNRCIEIDKLN